MHDPDDYTPHFPTTVDNTMLSAFMSCPQKFFNEFSIGIAPSGISPDLHAGGCFASALETARYSIYAEGKSVFAAICDAYPIYTRQWGLYEPPDMGSRTNPKTYLSVFHALVDYFREYPPDEDPLQPYMLESGKPALEFTFAIPLPINHPVTGDPLLYSGRFDMLSEFAPNMLCVLDEKTTKSFVHYWAKQWQMRGQFLGYVWAAQQHGYPCNHYAVRGIAIQKTQIQHLELPPTPVTTIQINDWYDNMLFKALRMVNCWGNMTEAGLESQVDENHYAQDNPHAHWDKSYVEACTQYGLCSFFDMCTSDEPAALYNTFERRHWDPLHKNPTADSPRANQDLTGMTLQELMA